MRLTVRASLLVMAAILCMSKAQTNNGSSDNKQQQQPQQQQQQRGVWDEPIRFNTKSKDACTMVVSGAADYTRLRVSCKGPSQGQTPGRSYYCDFQGKPNLCRPYNNNPRHYFTQMMWELRKVSHACQGAKVYRQQMCKKYPDEVHMTFLSSWPKTTSPKPSKPLPEPRKPVQPAQVKPVDASKPVKTEASQPVKPGKAPRVKTTTPKPVKSNTTRPSEQPESGSSRLATEYCWKSFHGLCSYVISWFQN
ncbi:fibroblast growth factor-binding protein 2b [Cynoglossus semilaevis]|uniref:fibroblast growth factor-binding protein 2b n=1 Tax=Cynoglossus semilaevis TaxID=244447 RepID=UPI0004960969|nr:fibroblast growth factor-binding protein 2 [Cynoglossus semilaevis]